MAGPEDVLGKIPKNTPPWAVGVVSIVVAVGIVFGVLYMTGRSEIQAYTASSLKRSEASADVERSVTSSILKLIQDNSTQLTQLSGALLKTQYENSELTQRVSAIEKELAVSNERMTACEAKLAKCK